MTPIAHQALVIAGPDPWNDVVSAIGDWADRHGLQLRDVIVLLPFAQLLPVARAAFGAAGGWLPRLETTQSLARALGPGERPARGQLTFDIAADRMAADRMLRAQPWAAGWRADDGRGHDQAVLAVVDTAHALARAAQALPPWQRDAHWEAARSALSIHPASAGAPGARERLLARVALEWAAAAAAPASDALFGLRAAGWVALQAGGPDALTRNLLHSAAVRMPCLTLDADVDPAAPFDAAQAFAQVRFAVCADFEAEAQRAAALVLQHLNEGTRPVALIAQDRLLVRRARALLARQDVPLRDETGWKLSTTLAGANVRGLLACARQGASTDEWLEWLKAISRPAPGSSPGPRFSPTLTPAALDELERELRRQRFHLARGVDPQVLPPAASALWQWAAQALSSLAGTKAAPAWLAALDQTLNATGQKTLLAFDEAGRQVLDALGLLAQPADDAGLDAADMLDLDGFAGWLDTVLEHASFLPESPVDASVVITPMARAMLRPFAAVVFPGADERHLAAADAPQALLTDAECVALGVAGSQARSDAALRAFALVLRLPRVSLLHRAVEQAEPLAASPWVERLKLAIGRHAGQVPPAAAPPGLVQTWLTAEPLARPQPRAPSLLPDRLSASACEALRTCPYRFFALRMLRLGGLTELDAELDKRDYGNWLHAVLQRFHAERPAPGGAPDEAERLHAMARQVSREQRLDEAEFLPYAATFARFVPRYLVWLHRRDEAGAQWMDAEVGLSARPPEWGTVEMRGVIDRVDHVDAGGQPVTQLIDYKTGRAQALKDAIRAGEDTQLPFYAALVAAKSDSAGPLSAIYLALDESDKVREAPHPDVEESARALVQGIGQELARLAAGATLPALGEGSACEHCEARGLCRRDHWAAAVDVAA